MNKLGKMVKKHRGFFGAVLGISGLLLSNYISGRSPFINSIPRTKTVQKGYVDTNRLEIFPYDADGNGEDETYVRIDKDSSKLYTFAELDGEPILLKCNPKNKDIEPYNYPPILKRWSVLTKLSLGSSKDISSKM